MALTKVRALADAAMMVNSTGLTRGRARWYVQGIALRHHFRTVHQLVEDGYLQIYGGGKTAHITQSGLLRLELERNR